MKSAEEILLSLDRPLEGDEADLLQRTEFAANISRALISPNRTSATGATIAVTGEWGSGKSSVLELVLRNLNALTPKPLVISFEPWITSGFTSLVHSFLLELKLRLEKEQETRADLKEKLRRAARSTEQYLLAFSDPAITVLSLVHPTLGEITKGGKNCWERWRDKQKKARDTLTNLRDALQTSIIALGIPVVVLIDEIDRLHDNEIRDMAQLVKAVASFRNVSFLLAYDAPRVAEALGGTHLEPKQAAERGRSYLQKIAQLELPLPLLSSDSLGVLRDFEQSEDFETLLDILFPLILRTPRDIARAFNGFLVRQRMIGHDVYWIDSLGFTVLEQKASSLAERIRQKPWWAVERGVPNPLQHEYQWEEMLKDGGLRERARKELGTDEQFSDDIDRLVGFLFPFLGADQSVYDGGNPSHPDRIANGPPLVALLNLGLPDGAITAKEVIDFAANDGAAREAELGKRIANGSFQAFVSRLGQVLPRLSRDQLREVWRSIGASMDSTIRNPAQDSGLERLGLMETVLNAWNKAGEYETRIHSEASGLADQLLVDGSIHLLSGILWQELQLGGVFGIPENIDGPEDRLLTLSQTEALAIQLSEKLAEELIHRDKFLGLRSFHPLFLCCVTKKWQERHRSMLTKLVERNDVLDALIAVIFTGTRDEPPFIDELIGRTNLAARVRQRIDPVHAHDVPSQLKGRYAKARRVLLSDRGGLETS
jgi:hypothetical protein